MGFDQTPIKWATPLVARAKYAPIFEFTGLFDAYDGRQGVVESGNQRNSAYSLFSLGYLT